MEDRELGGVRGGRKGGVEIFCVKMVILLTPFGYFWCYSDVNGFMNHGKETRIDKFKGRTNVPGFVQALLCERVPVCRAFPEGQDVGSGYGAGVVPVYVGACAGVGE